MDTKKNVIKGLKEGDSKALKVIYNYYNLRLFHFVNGITKSTDEAEDIVAETFMRLWNARKEFNSEESIKAFLFISAKNASLNSIRGRTRYLNQLSEINYLSGGESQEWEPMPVEVELLDVIASALEGLPNGQKEVLKLILFERLTDKQIAKRLNKRLKTIYNLKYLAISYLRKLLSDRNLSYPILILVFLSS